MERGEDPRYETSVNGLPPDQVGRRLRLSIANVIEYFPEKTGVIIVAFDFAKGGGVGFISNAVRSDAILILRDWIARMEAEA